MIDDVLLFRIERALRGDLWDAGENTEESVADKDFIKAAYSRLKGEKNDQGFRNSFTECAQKARIEWLRTVLK